MEPEYEDGISGIAYVIDEESFPDGYLAAEDMSETLITISSAVKKNGKNGRMIGVANGATVKKEKKEKKEKQRKLRGGSGIIERQLSPTTGTSSLLVLFAIPPDATNNNRNAVQLQDDIFGIGGTDPVNVRSQILACSRGQLDYVPACGNLGGPSCSHPLIVNGVMEVPITDNVSGVASGTVVNWVTTAANALLDGSGISLNSFTQIMHVIPDEADWGGAAAWAYLPGRVSAFRDAYANRMGVQVSCGESSFFVHLYSYSFVVLYIPTSSCLHCSDARVWPQYRSPSFGLWHRFVR